MKNCYNYKHLISNRIIVLGICYLKLNTIYVELSSMMKVKKSTILLVNNFSREKI